MVVVIVVAVVVVVFTRDRDREIFIKRERRKSRLDGGAMHRVIRVVSTNTIMVLIKNVTHTR